MFALWTAAGQVHAQDTWSTPFPGVRHLSRRASGPRRIYAAVIDLCAAGVTLRATAESEHHRTVPSYASLVGADLAINADFYNTSTFRPTSPAVHGGVSWGARDTDALGFLAFGVDRALVSPLGEVHAPLPSWMREVVGGRPLLVRSGEAVRNTGDLCTVRHPRTMAGLSADRRRLILAVVDGRSSASIGMTCAEESALLIELGVDIGMNLDGGGSSTMWLRGDGVVNRPSDGTPRSVSNHLAIFADGSGAPSSCMPYAPYELEALTPAIEGTLDTDVDGDGMGDLCVRAAAGIRCATSSGTAFEAAFVGPALADDSGWSDPDNYRTIVMGDVTGDGLADVCARANAGVRCYPSTGIGFDAAIVGPELSDASSWDEPRYHATLAIRDVDGDGIGDLCARAAAGARCWRSDGGAFTAWGEAAAAFSNANGFGDAQRWATIRYLDLDGDGRTDVCGRAAEGIRCVRSTGTGWDTAVIEGPAWSDESGWSSAMRAGTIRVGDVDGDGMDDLCARAASGYRCHLSTGTGFGGPFVIDALSDEGGWTELSYWETIRLADIDGDGDRDVCARAAAGVRCFAWEGEGFGAMSEGPELADGSGWSRARYYRTLRFGDVDGDGDDDLCARAAAGMRCWAAEDGVFGEAIVGPAWSDEQGFWADRFHETIRFATRRLPLVTEMPDAGVARDGGAVTGDGGSRRDGGSMMSERDGGMAERPSLGGTCACRAGRRRSGTPWLALVTAALLYTARRRR